MKNAILEAMKTKRKILNENTLAEEVGGDRDAFDRHMETFHADGSIWRGTDGTQPMCTLASHLAILNGDEPPEAVTAPAKNSLATLNDVVDAIDRLTYAVSNVR